MLWLLSALGWAKSALRAALGVFTRYPLHCALIAALALSGVLWQRGNRYQAKLADCTAGRAADRAAYTAAQLEAERLAKEARARQEAAYRAKAERADDDHETELADARAAAERFIAARRVRAETVGRAASGTVASAPDRDSGVSEAMPADAVMVSASDVRACTDAVAYGVAARTWALGLDVD